MTPRSVQAQNLANLNRCGPKLGEASRFNGGSKLPVGLHSAPSKSSNHTVSLVSKTVPVRQPLKPAPKRLDISELPRIPKIKKEANGGHLESQPASNRSGDIPRSCITQLTGKGSAGQPIRGSKMEGGTSGAPQRQPHASGGTPAAHAAARGISSALPSRGKVGSSSFESFKINIPGNVGQQSSRLSNPGFCNTFRPVDNKVQQKENPSPLFSLKKTKPVKSEIYDPFDPTGSDSSSTNSSPERLPLTNITRTISIASPKVQTFQTVRRITPYMLENIFGSGAESSDVQSSNTESNDDAVIKERIVEQVSDTEQEKMDEEELSSTPCTSSSIKQEVPDVEHLLKESSKIVSEDYQGKFKVKMDLDSPVSEDEQQNTLKNEPSEKLSLSRSPSNSSSLSQKKLKQKKTAVKEYKPTKSRSRSRTHSRDRSSRSTSRSGEESQRIKSKVRQSSSDHSSSCERSKKKKAKDKTRDKKAKSSWPKEHKRSRSRSASPGNSCFEHYEGRKKKKHSSSRGRERECSFSSSAERIKKKKHRRERSYERYEKERSSRSRERKRSRSRSPERRKRRSRSSSPSRFREHKRTKEKPVQSRSWSKEGKHKPKEVLPLPPQEKGQRSSGDSLNRSLEPAPPPLQELEDTMQEPLTVHVDVTPAQEMTVKDDVKETALEEPITVEQVCENLINEAILSQLECTGPQTLTDNINSSLKLESAAGDESPELSRQKDTTTEEIALEKEDVCPFLTDSLLKEEELVQDGDEATPTQSSAEIKTATEANDAGLVLDENAADVYKPELEAVAQGPVLKSKALVKRVTWNLQEEGSDTLTVDKTPSKHTVALKSIKRPRCGCRSHF